MQEVLCDSDSYVAMSVAQFFLLSQSSHSFLYEPIHCAHKNLIFFFFLHSFALAECEEKKIEEEERDCDKKKRNKNSYLVTEDLLNVPKTYF